MRPMETGVDEIEALRRQVVASDSHVLDLRVLIIELWRWKWLIVLFLLAGAAYGIRDLRNFVPKYEAQMLVAPAEGSGEFTIAGGRGGGLNSLVQSLVTRGGASATTFDRLSVMFSSVSLAEYLQRKYGLLQVIFKSSWDEKNQRWIAPKTGKPGWRDKLRAYFHFNSWREPDIQTLANYIGGLIRIEQKENSPFKAVTVRHRDRDFALRMLKTAYWAADELLREQDRIEVERRRAYIESQLARTTLVDSRAALIALLAGEERRAMLLNSDLPYAARVIEPPRVSAQPREPSVARLVGLPVVVAGVLGFVVVSVIAAFRRE